MENIVYDSWDLKYKNPFGAVKEEEIIRFCIQIPLNLAFSSVVLKIRNSEGNVENIQLIYEKTENSMIYYRCDYITKLPDIYFYYFEITNTLGVTYIKKTNSHLGFLTKNIYENDFQLTVFSKDAKTPDCYKGGIAYQIFPDRFFFSGNDKDKVPNDRVLRYDWGELPHYLPDENGQVKNNDYFCGDLEGIEKKLPYLKSLGVDLIYLNPIFEAHSNHRYNTANYMKIDPLLGDEDDFKSLTHKAKKLGIKIILDGVFNHTGDDSIYFNKENRYDTIGAYNDKNSRYFNWFIFYNHPNDYHSWWGFTTLPTINKKCVEFIDYICGEDGVLMKWLNLGASGYRLDVADELLGSFIEKIRTTIKSHNKDNLLIGEVWEDATNKEAYGVLKKYFLGKELDGTMNYPFKEAIIRLLRYKNKQEFINSIMTIYENYPSHAMNVALNSLSTHDIPRVITSLVGESCEGKDRNWQATHNLTNDEFQHGVTLLKGAMVLQYFLPGIPCIYYGDEAGLYGYKDPFNRKCYPWGNENKELLEFTKLLAKFKKQFRDILKDGNLKFIDTIDGVVGFCRYNIKSKLLVYLNYTDNVKHVPIYDTNYRIKYGYISNDKIEIEPYSFSLLYN